MAPGKITANESGQKTVKKKLQAKKVNKKKVVGKNKHIIKKVGETILKENDAKDVAVKKIKAIKNEAVPKKKKILKKIKPKVNEKQELETSPDVPVQMTEICDSNSIQEGNDAFTWLIAPVLPRTFFNDVWEKTPLHIKRTDFPDYYKALLSTKKIDRILHDDYVLFSKNIDITSYCDGVRLTHNPSGRAIPAVVWDFYKKGCSVRMLNPQSFSKELQKLNSTLQEYFGCFVGANSYLTPKNTQGFAPHYDDIEAFILQIEGKKHWKIYAPKKPSKVLPRFSSKNFKQSELGKPVLEVTLHPGDLLYFPRGFTHQANTEPDAHSLHITVSAFQKNTWGDFLEKLLPAALAIAQEEDVEFRKGLPVNYLSHVGVSRCDLVTRERQQFLAHLEKLVLKLLQHAPVDAAADQIGKQFMHDALPPVLSQSEMKCSVFSNTNYALENGQISGYVSLSGLSRIKLLRAHILRLVKEDSDRDSVHVYHCIDNSLEYHREEPRAFEISSDLALALEFLTHKYPAFTTVDDLPLDKSEDKLALADLLWRKGLLLTEKPLQATLS